MSHRTDELKCRVCDDIIDFELPHVEEEITEWDNAEGGKSTTYWYHKTCFGVSRR